MPASVNPKCYHQSASSVAAFKKCPTLWRLAYREGIRSDRDTDSQRQGTNWGSLHEVYGNALRLHDPVVQQGYPDPKDYALQVVIEHLNQRYAECPTWVPITDWMLERQILLTSFIGYLWYWQNDPVEYLASEVPFNLPLYAPRTGLPLLMDEVQRVGKMDHVIKWQTMIGPMERKSTSRSIAHDSDYWDKSKKDTQVSMYAAALREMAASGNLPDSVAEILYGDYEQGTEGQALSATPARSSGPEQGMANGPIAAGEAADLVCEAEGVQSMPRETEAVSAIPSPRPNNETVFRGIPQGHPQSATDVDRDSEMRSSVCQLPLVPARGRKESLMFGATLFDVWHKPTIAPKPLTQKDTAAFIETGSYFDQKFEVASAGDQTKPETWEILIDGEKVGIEIGKKGFAIRESIAMYGARLLNDIYERPEFYYARREIVRTDEELRKFRTTLYNIYQAQKNVVATGGYWEDESQCRSSYPCQFIPICYGKGADAICESGETPPGFKRIFTPLTIFGKAVSDED